MIRFAIFAALMISAMPAAAQNSPVLAFSDAAPADYPGVVALGTGEGQPQEDWFRMNGALQVRNVREATLTPFLPPANANSGAAVIIAPGGAFLGLAIEDEGFRVARWLADHGVAAFVLKYRVLPTPEVPAVFRREVVAVRTGKGLASFRPPEDTPPQSLADGIAAIQHVKEHAAQYRIDSSRVGMMGFSAGAFLTLSVTLSGPKESRPAFIAAIYGEQQQVAVPGDASPMFALVAADDPLFGKAGFALVDSWRAAGVPVELHLLQTGGHGFGLGAAGTSSVDWIVQFHKWLSVNKMLGGQP